MEQLGMNVTEADSQQQIFGVEYGSMMALVNQQTHTHQPIRAAFAAYSADSQPQQCFIPSAFNSSGTTRSTLPLQPKLEDPQNSASGIGIGQLVNAEFISEHSAAAAAAADCQDGRDKERSKAIDENDAIKSKIVSHVHYPRLVNAYLDCQKIGAPEDVIAELEEVHNKCQARQCSASLSVGMDPELDHFMEAYCELFVRYHEELSRPFKEATDFFRKIEMQLSSMTKGAIKTYSEGEGMGESASSEEEEEGEGSARERDIIDIHPHSHPHPHAEDRLLKQHLLRKYSGYLSGLKQEFLKKKKKGKLPKEARQKLMDWWSAHYKWPYPSEAQKIALAESTGLDQKQINNWFINQRKRHWKPSEEMQFVVMEPPPTHHHHHHHHNQLYHHHPSFSMDC